MPSWTLCPATTLGARYFAEKMALPQPPKTSQKVPSASAPRREVSAGVRMRDSPWVTQVGQATGGPPLARAGTTLPHPASFAHVRHPQWVRAARASALTRDAAVRPRGG